MSDPQALHVTRNVIPGKLGVDLHLHRVHIPLVTIHFIVLRYSSLNCPGVVVQPVIRGFDRFIYMPDPYMPSQKCVVMVVDFMKIFYLPYK